MQPVAFPDVSRHLARIEHAGQQGGHIFPGIKAFQISGLIGYRRIGSSMGFIERVRRERGHIVEDCDRHIFGNAAAFATLHHHRPVLIGQAVEEDLPLPFHHIVFFLGHGPADHIGPAEGIPRELTENLHDLLLIHDTAVGHVQNRLQGRVEIPHLFRMVTVMDIFRNRIHRARTEQGRDRDQILKPVGPELQQHPLHAGGFILEHPVAVGLGHHPVDLRGILGDILDGKPGFTPADHLHRVGDDGQIAQAEKIHFQETQFLQDPHGILGGDGIPVEAEGHILAHRLRGDDHPGGMGGRVPRHPLHLAGHLDEFPDLRIALILLPQFFGQGQGPVQRHIQLPGNRFGHCIRQGVGQAQSPGHIPDGGPCCQGSEGDDLGHVVGSVFADNVVDDLLPLLVAEIDVEIGHTHPFGVEEPFEQQVVFDGVDAGDADAIGAQAPGPRAPPRPHRDIVVLGVLDKIMDDQVIIHVSHLLDGGKLVFQPLRDRGIGMFAVMPAQPLIAALPEIGGAVPPGGVEPGELGLAEGQLDPAALRDPDSVVECLGEFGKQHPHLLLRFEVEFLRLKGHGIGLVHRGVGLDADKDLLHPGVLFGEVVGVVGADERDARLPGQTHDLRADGTLLLQPVVLELQEEVLRPEYVAVFQRDPFGPVIVSLGQRPGDLPGQTGRQGDEPLMVFPQQLPIHTGPAVEALGPGGGDHLDEIVVSRLILTQQHQMGVLAVRAVNLVEPCAGRHIRLAAEDRLDTGFLRLFIEVHQAVHDAVIGHGHGLLPQRGRPLHQPRKAAGTVEQAIFAVYMQMYESHPPFPPCVSRPGPCIWYDTEPMGLCPAKSPDTKPLCHTRRFEVRVPAGFPEKNPGPAPGEYKYRRAPRPGAFFEHRLRRHCSNRRPYHKGRRP